MIAGIAIGHFVSGVKLRLGTGMTGFDSTWYHGPFAAGFYQSGNTIDLHFIAPQFLAWFYPANSEVVHAIGMLAFSRDLLSPLLNLGWLVGACWRVGASAGRSGSRPGRWPWARSPCGSRPWSTRRGRRATTSSGSSSSSRRMADRPELRPPDRRPPTARDLPTGALLLVGLAIGLAAGTKLNFLLPAAVLVLGLTALAPRGRRWTTLACSGGMALAGGGYWLLRNLVQAGNPLPWIHHLGPITLPRPNRPSAAAKPTASSPT